MREWFESRLASPIDRLPHGKLQMDTVLVGCQSAIAYSVQMKHRGSTLDEHIMKASPNRSLTLQVCIIHSFVNRLYTWVQHDGPVHSFIPCFHCGWGPCGSGICLRPRWQLSSRSHGHRDSNPHLDSPMERLWAQDIYWWTYQLFNLISRPVFVV